MENGFFKKCDQWAIKYDAFSLAFFANVFLGLLFISPRVFGLRYVTIPKELTQGAAVTQWIRLRLPSCRPGFKTQAHYLRFYQFKL